MGKAEPEGQREVALLLEKRAFIVLCVVSVLLAGLCLRLHRIGEENVWFDESVSTVMDPSTSLGEYLANVAHWDPTLEPLYHVLLWSWCRCFGHGELTMRALSIVFGMASLLVLMLMARDLFDRWEEALLVGMLVAASTADICFARMIRMYALYMFLASVSMWGMVRMLRDRAYGGPLTVGANMLLLWTHLLSPTLMLFEAAGLLLHYRRRPMEFIKWCVPQGVNAAVWWFGWGQFMDVERIRRAAAYIAEAPYGFDYLKLSYASRLGRHGYENGIVGEIVLVFILCGMCAACVRLGRLSDGSRTALGRLSDGSRTALGRLSDGSRTALGNIQIAKYNGAQIFIVTLALSHVPFMLTSMWIYAWWQPRYTIFTAHAVVLAVVFGFGIIRRVTVRRMAYASILLTALAGFALSDFPLGPGNWKAMTHVIDSHAPVYFWPEYKTPEIQHNLPGRKLIPVDIRQVEQTATEGGSWLVVINNPKAPHGLNLPPEKYEYRGGGTDWDDIQVWKVL